MNNAQIRMSTKNTVPLSIVFNSFLGIDVSHMGGASPRNLFYTPAG